MKTWVAGEELFAADLQSFIQNQVVPAFANPTARDAQWVSPANGAFCVCVDTGSLFQRIGGIWYRPFNELGYSERSTDTGSVAAGSPSRCPVSPSRSLSPHHGECRFVCRCMAPTAPAATNASCESWKAEPKSGCAGRR